MLEIYCIDGVLISILLYCLLCVFSVHDRSQVSKGASFVVHIGILLFCVFAFWSQDYYSYLEFLKAIDFRFPDAEQQTHIEPLYVWIGYFVKGDYTLFRLCIWGVSYILFLKSLQNLGIYNRQVIALFIVYFLLIFSYARVSLGMASLFYGVSLLLKSDKNRILNIFIGLAMLFLAYNAHKSMFVAIAVLPFIILRLNKYTLMILAIGVMLFAWLYGGVFVSDMLHTNTIDDEYGEFIQESAASYFTADTVEWGIASQLISITQIISLVCPIIYCYANANVFKYVSTNFMLRCFVNYSTILLLIGISFGLVLSFNSPISYRLMFMAYIPNIIITCTLYKNQVLSQKLYNRFFFLFALYSVVRLSYALYLQMIL